MNGIERILGFLPYERMHWGFPNGRPLAGTAEIKRIFRLALPNAIPSRNRGPKCATIALAYGIFSRYAGDLNAPATEYLKIQNSPI